MRVTHLELPPPRCLRSVRTGKPDAALLDRLVRAFVTDEDDERALARHAELGREPASWLSTREELVAWTLGCPCGSDRGKLFGVRIDDQFRSPVRFACTACSESAPLFDALTDGWNAETAKRKRKPRKDPKTTFAMHCRSCKNTLWRPAAIVTYQGENYADLAIERVPDCFDVILLGGTCATCETVAFGFAEECA